MKKLLKLSVLTAGLLTLMGACSNDEMPDFPAPDATTQTPPSGLDRALRIVDEMMKELDGGATRSSRRIATIEKVNQLTRSDAQAPNWFLLNFESDAGFALITDAIIESPVYAISDAGHLSMSDTIENKALAKVLSNIFIMGYVDTMNEAANAGNMNTADTPYIPGDGYYPGELKKPSTLTDSLIKIPWKEPCWLEDRVLVAPRLTKHVQKWGQLEPFNILCPTIHDNYTGEEKHGYIGSAPLAMAMIMSHYQWPKSYYSASPNETYEFHWDEIRDYSYRYAMSRLTREISRAYNMDAQWENSGTYVNQTNAPKTFENFGYKKPVIERFDSIGLHTILNLKSPLLLMCDNHMWVVDGLYRRVDGTSGISDTRTVWETFYYYHNVWGHNGESNGYFRMTDGIGNEEFDGKAYQYDDPDIYNHTGYVFYDINAIGRLYHK